MDQPGFFVDAEDADDADVAASTCEGCGSLWPGTDEPDAVAGTEAGPIGPGPG